MTAIERPTMNRSDGFALVLSLLFTGIVLMIVVSTAATTTLNSRRGGVDERTSYQTLLTAETGLNTLPRRLGEYIRTAPYTGTTQSDLQTWLNAANVTSYAVPSGTDTLSVTATSATTFSAVSTGTLSSSKKVVAQDFRVVDRTLPPGLKPHSGVTSGPPINASGSPQIRPTAANGSTTPTTTITTVATSATLPAATTAVTVNVTDARGLRTGDYIGISGTTFRVNSISGNNLALTRVPAAGATSTTLSGNVTLLLNAVAQSYSAVTSPMTIKISNVADFTVNEVVSIGSARATVTTVDAYAKTVTLAWQGTSPSSLSEGTPVNRDVTAMSSGGTISIGNANGNTLNNYQGVVGGTITNDCTTSGSKSSQTTTCSGSNNTALNDPATFTQTLLGMTDAELNDMVPSTPTSSLSGLVMNGQMLRIKASDFSTVITNGTSTGVLIVDGNIDANINGNRTFNGFIYVRGCVTKLNGNLTLNGGIAIRGGNNCTSSVLGNLTVNYNMVALRSTIMNATGSKQVVATAQSWRMQ